MKLHRDGAEIHYEVYGKGPAVVFAHGLGGNHLSWWQQVAQFAPTHTCVVFETGSTLCWGDNFYGQLGQGNTNTVGDNETLATLFPIDLGADAEQIVAGRHHTCALLTGGGVKCWGRNLYGQLGTGGIDHIGDDEVPAAIPAIDLGGPAQAITTGDYHTCALLDEREILCWGLNDYGQLGYGDTLLRGDDESPVDAGGVPVL